MRFETIEIKNTKGTQSIRIPRKMKINDDKAYLKKVGNSLHVIPFHHAWQNMIDSLGLFTSDFMEERGQTTNQQQREKFDE